MRLYSFKGGIHPPERKELTHDKPIQQAYPSTKSVCIPITQGGAPNQILVAVGDKVARGQKIAASDAFMSAPVHASIAGTVKKIETHLVTGNLEVPCIIIQSDDSERTEFLPSLDPFLCSKEEALARVREAGIVGMGGAAFPTHVKLNPPAGKTIQYVIANAAECEPYLTIDERTIAEMPQKLVDGIAIDMKITGASSGIIALEDNKKHLVPLLQKTIDNIKKPKITMLDEMNKYLLKNGFIISNETLNNDTTRIGNYYSTIKQLINNKDNVDKANNVENSDDSDD